MTIQNEYNKDLNMKDAYEGHDAENKELNRDPITGEVGSQPVGTAAGTMSGALAGAALGAVIGPIGAVAGAVAGGVAGAIAGHQIGETVNPTQDLHHRDVMLKDEQPVETGVGAGAGAMIGAVLGSVAGPIGTAAGAAVGAAAGGYAGHGVGEYADEKGFFKKDRVDHAETVVDSRGNLLDVDTVDPALDTEADRMARLHAANYNTVLDPVEVVEVDRKTVEKY